MTPTTGNLTIWLLQIGEPLPIDLGSRSMRTSILASALISRGHRVVWFASKFNHGTKEMRASGPKHIKLSDSYRLVILGGLRYRGNLSIGRIVHQHYVALDFYRTASTLPKPDLVIASYPAPELCWAAARYCKKHDVPLVIDIRDPWPDIFRSYLNGFKYLACIPLCAYYSSLFKKAARASVAILAVSRAMLDLGLCYAARSKRTLDAVLHIGYDLTPSQVVSNKSYDFSEEHPLICLFIGTFGQSYDGETIINAMRLLHERGCKSIKTVMVGEGQNSSRWRELGNSLPNLKFTGWLGKDELNEQFAMGHVGLALYGHGLRDFAMPNKLFEYMAFGLAVVNSLDGEAAQLVETQAIGVNTPAGNPGRLAELLEDLANHPEKVACFGKNARGLMESSFSARIIYSDYVARIERLAGRLAD